MSEGSRPVQTRVAHSELPSDIEDLAQGIADQIESFLVALREVARATTRVAPYPSCCSRCRSCSSPAGASARRATSSRDERFEPDTGLGRRRRRAARPAGRAARADIDGTPRSSTRTTTRASSSPAALRRPRRHRGSARARAAAHRAGRADEALWWWQFSYLSSLGCEALGGAARAAVGGRHDRSRRATGRGDRHTAEPHATDGQKWRAHAASQAGVRGSGHGLAAPGCR